MRACQTCGGYGMKHDPVAHDAEPCDHDWISRGHEESGDEWAECWLCGEVEDR